MKSENRTEKQGFLNYKKVVLLHQMTDKHNYKKIEFNINTEAELSKIIDKVLEIGIKKVVLYGQIGAGKTTFVKAFCTKLQTQENAHSPTYSLVNEYEYATGFVYHFDLYRLKTLEEALDIGIEDYLDDEHYCFIEWAELIDNILPESFIELHFTPNKDGSRTVNMIY